MYLRRIRHDFGPNVKAAVQACELPAGGNLPATPDAFAFVKALIEDVVFADVALGPVTFAVRQVIATTDDEGADPIAALAGHAASAKRELQLHQMAAGKSR